MGAEYTNNCLFFWIYLYTFYKGRVGGGRLLPPPFCIYADEHILHFNILFSNVWFWNFFLHIMINRLNYGWTLKLKYPEHMPVTRSFCKGGGGSQCCNKEGAKHSYTSKKALYHLKRGGPVTCPIGQALPSIGARSLYFFHFWNYNSKVILFVYV